jgi:DNA-binding transcriptional LysR family regulator
MDEICPVDMEIADLAIVQALVEDPHLSRAALRFKMTQSALSKKVQHIERELGCELFERRGPRGLKPKPEALEFASMAERLMNTWDRGIRRIQTLSKEPTHFVLVGPQLFLREVILPWWQKMQPQFPEVTLEVRVSSLSRVSIETIQSGADAGILEHKEELADYVCKLIYQERWGIVRNPSTKKDALTDYAWGTYSLRDNPVDTWLVKKQKMPPPDSYKLYWADLTALAIWVAETPGAASVLPWHTVAWLEKRKRLIFEPLSGVSTKKLYLAYEKNNPHRRLLDALAQLSNVVGLSEPS